MKHCATCSSPLDTKNGSYCSSCVKKRQYKEYWSEKFVKQRADKKQKLIARKKELGLIK